MPPAEERPILIVDDDEDDQRFLKTHLEKLFGSSSRLKAFKSGYQLMDYLEREVLHRHGAAEAEACRPWMILLDLHMPGMDGLHVLERLHGHAALADTILLVLSGSRNSREIAATYRSGAYSFLPKPFTRSDLISAMHRHKRGEGPDTRPQGG